MEKELRNALISALSNEASANFSAEDVNAATINALMEELGLNENSSAREIRAVEERAFALIEEAVDVILPKKLENLLGQFAEIRSFARDAEVIFNIEKLGKNRAKLTIVKGARGGIYKAARLDRKFFSVPTQVYTVAVYVTLEELILGTMSLGELFANILEGFEEIVYKEVFNALASGSPAAGYARISDTVASASSTTKANLGATLDKVLPYVKQYGQPTIFGSYQALSGLYNPLANVSYAAGYPNHQDSEDIREHGLVQIYKGVKVVELPNYLVDEGNDAWFYDVDYVFVMPSGAKPVKIALKGDLTIIKNVQAVGSEKWEAHKIMGVGVAMANNFAVIRVTDAQ